MPEIALSRFLLSPRAWAWAVFCLLVCALAQAPAKEAPSPFDAWRTRLLAQDDEEGLFALEEIDTLLGAQREPAPLIAALERAAEQKGAHLERRLRSAYALGRLYRLNGELDKARALLRRLGFLTRWQVSGPYGNEGDFGMREELAPERGFDPGATLGPNDPAPAWRPYPQRGGRKGYTDLRAVFAPGGKALAYALARLNSSKEQTALLTFGAYGPSRVWLNGRLLISFNEARKAGALQEVRLVRLVPGPNTLLIKSATSAKGFGFYAALLDEQGQALDGLSGQSEEDAAQAPWPAAALPTTLQNEAPPLGPPLLLEKALERFDRAQTSANALAVARLHHLRRNTPYEENLAYEWALQAALDKGATHTTWLFAARYARERNAKLQAAERAQALAPDDYRPLLLLARVYAEAELPTRALTLLAQAAQKPGGARPALLLRLELLARLDVPGLALAELNRAGAGAPLSPSLLIRQAALCDQLGLVEQARTAQEALLAARPGRIRSLRWLINQALSRRDYTEATTLLLRLYPFTRGTSGEARRLALLHMGQGRYGEASAVYAEAVLQSPNDPTLIAEWAEIEHALGHEARALELFLRAQKIAPQDLDLARRVAVFAAPAPDFAASYLLSGAELQAAVAQAEPQTSREVYELAAYRVNEQGLLSRAEQHVVIVGDEETLRDWRNLVIPYDPDTQSLRLLHTRIHKPDGRVLLTREEDETEVAPSYGQYFGGRLRRLHLPALSRGDWLDVAWRLDDIRQDALSGHLAIFRFTQGRLPKSRQRLILETPPALAPAIRAPRLAATSPEAKSAAGYTLREWTGRELPALTLEPNGPPLAERSDFLHVTSFGDIRALGAWYTQLIAAGQKAGGELAATARALTAGAQSESERLRAVFDFTREKLRYVGLEFGVHGYLPYAAADVLQRRFGDCKDKAVLFIALARALGSEAELVLLRQPELGLLEPGLASLLPYNHAVVYLPKEKRFVDPTDTYGDFDFLPERDQGGQAIVLAPGGAYETRLPQSPPQSDRYEQRTRWRFTSEPGTLAQSGELRVGGAAAALWRERFAENETRQRQLAESLNHDWPGTQLKSARFPADGSTAGPFVLAFEALAPGFAQKTEGGLALRPTLDRLDLVERFCATAARQTPLRIASSFSVFYESTIELGAHRLLAAPAPLSFESGPLRFTRERQQSADTLTLRFTLTLTAGQVEPALYPAFAQACQSAAAAFVERIEVTP